MEEQSDKITKFIKNPYPWNHMAAEKRLQDKTIRLIKDLGLAGHPIHFLKVHGNGVQRAGEPDLILCVSGKMVCIELKAPGKKATKLQRVRLDHWASAGAESLQLCYKNIKVL